MAMNQQPTFHPSDAHEFVTLRQWMQERRDICGLLSLYAPARPHETLLQQLARVLRSVNTGSPSRNNATVLMLTNLDHSSQI
jgi:hypothetical protein